MKGQLACLWRSQICAVKSIKSEEMAPWFPADEASDAYLRTLATSPASSPATIEARR